MALIGGRGWSRTEIERRVGGMGQLGGIRHCELVEGRARGVRAAVVDTGAGLSFTVLPDRGLDIADCTFKGTGLVYHAPGGIAHPAFHDPAGSEWLRVFFGGLLTTCGLTYFGDPGRDGAEDLGLHGRYSSLPARQVCDLSRWEGDEYVLEMTGEVEETRALRRQAAADPVDHHAPRREEPARARHRAERRSPALPLHDPVPRERGVPAAGRVERAPGRLALDRALRPARGRRTRRRCAGSPPQIRRAVGLDYLHTMAVDADGYTRAAVVNRRLGLGLGLRCVSPPRPSRS